MMKKNHITRTIIASAVLFSFKEGANKYPPQRK